MRGIRLKDVIGGNYKHACGGRSKRIWMRRRALGCGRTGQWVITVVTSTRLERTKQIVSVLLVDCELTYRTKHAACDDTCLASALVGKHDTLKNR